MQVKASLKNLRVSPIKVNYVMRLIRNVPAMRALDILKFCRKRIAKDVYKLVHSAVSNAENNHNLDIDNLVVKEAYVGKGLVLKRMDCRAKGRGNMIQKPFSHLYVILSDNEEERNGSKG